MATSSSRKRIAVLIPNYRTAGLTIDCLASLESEIEKDTDATIVIDNGSVDGSPELIEKAVAQRGWGASVRVILSPFNVGFPAACNMGLRTADADYYILLNNDTVVQSGMVKSLLKAAAGHPKAGIIIPDQIYPDGEPQSCCFRFRSPIAEFNDAASTGILGKLLSRYTYCEPFSDSPAEPEWVCFACVMIRREVIDEIGLLEDGYFLYFDDVDYCRRAWKAGWHVLYWPEAKVVHLVGKSNPLESLAAARKRKPYYFYASRSWYFAKFYGRLGLLAANLLWMAGRAISLARELAGSKRPHTCEKEWLDIWTNFCQPFKPPRRWEEGSVRMHGHDAR